MLSTYQRNHIAHLMFIKLGAKCIIKHPELYKDRNKKQMAKVHIEAKGEGGFSHCI